MKKLFTAFILLILTSTALADSTLTPAKSSQDKCIIVAAAPGCPGMCQQKCSGNPAYSSCYQVCLRNCK